MVEKIILFFIAFIFIIAFFGVMDFNMPIITPVFGVIDFNIPHETYLETIIDDSIFDDDEEDED